MKLNGEFSTDFGILAVRAGQDYGDFSDRMFVLTDWAEAEDVDVTTIEYPEAVHGFDVTMDTPRTREIILKTLEFLQERLQVEK